MLRYWKTGSGKDHLCRRIGRVSAVSALAGAMSLLGCGGGSGSGSGSGSTPTPSPAPALTSTSTTVSTAATSVLQTSVPIELVAQVSSAAGSSAVSGSVNFTDNGAALGTATLDASGRAITTVTTLAAGTHALTASYNGDAAHAGSASAASSLTLPAVPGAHTYTNPLTLTLTGGRKAISCADPAILKVQSTGVELQSAGIDTWYLYCTGDALFAGDRVHFINVFESTDLQTWTYDGDAFAGLPVWTPNGMLWAPAIRYSNGQYMLYFATPSTNFSPANGAAIGVGVSGSPKGPFVDHGSPVVEPELTSGDCCGGRPRSTIDPDVVTADGQNYIRFGSFDGGIFVRKLSADGFTSDPASETQIAATNRYEGGAMGQHGGMFYLFASSANCCNGPVTGYSVFVGRASSPMGPFVDRLGVSMTAANAGGTEVLAQNGNAWIGPGGNVLFSDESGRDYMLYHAVSIATPVYAGTTNYTARPALIDPVAWSADGWPIVRGGFGPSATPQPAPVAQPGQSGQPDVFATELQTNDAPAVGIAPLSDEFNAATLSPKWTTLHGAPQYTLSNGALQLPTVGLDSCCSMSTLPMLAEAAPETDYIVETKLTLNLPATGSGLDYTQGDLFILGDDRNFVRLDLYANGPTRQVEFVKQMSAQPAYAANSGSSNLAEPSLTGSVVSVYLRIAKRTIDGQATYTAYSSQDGATWSRGATWNHTLTNERIAIAASNRAGYTASFDYVRVSTIQ